MSNENLPPGCTSRDCEAGHTVRPRRHTGSVFGLLPKEAPTPKLVDCPNCDGKGWYADMNCSDKPWESEQRQCAACYGEGKVIAPDSPKP